MRSNCVATDAAGREPQPGRAVCPRRARNTAHNSSRGGTRTAAGAAAAMNGSRLPPGPGCQGPRRPRAQREQWPGQGPRWPRLGLQLTARPGAPVPSRAQRGRFPGRRADVCTGVGVGAPPCRGRGQGGRAARSSRSREEVGAAPRRAPGSAEPQPSPTCCWSWEPSAPHQAGALGPPQASSLLRAKPPPSLRGLPPWAWGGTDLREGGQPGPEPGPCPPRAGSACPCLR